MKVEKDLRDDASEQTERKNEKIRGNSVRSFAVLTVCAVLAMIISFGTKISIGNGNNRVYAAADTSRNSTDEEAAVPTGIAGVVSGVSDTPSSGSTITRIGSSCEQVIVGQRVQKVTNTAADLNVSSSMENKVNELDARSITLAENPTLMSDEDYDTLLRIVEAEAGSEDIKGRVLVANVIMNRVKSGSFPNSISGVIYQSGQFTPASSGKLARVLSSGNISSSCYQAAAEALSGADNTGGAKYFHAGTSGSGTVIGSQIFY